MAAMTLTGRVVRDYNRSKFPKRRPVVFNDKLKDGRRSLKVWSWKKDDYLAVRDRLVAEGCNVHLYTLSGGVIRLLVSEPKPKKPSKPKLPKKINLKPATVDETFTIEIPVSFLINEIRGEFKGKSFNETVLREMLLDPKFRKRLASDMMEVWSITNSDGGVFEAFCDEPFIDLNEDSEVEF